jgi:hypothetical protein
MAYRYITRGLLRGEKADDGRGRMRGHMGAPAASFRPLCALARLPVDQGIWR